MEYCRKFVARAAEKLALLSEGSAITEVLNDYAAMREQGRVCSNRDR